MTQSAGITHDDKRRSEMVNHVRIALALADRVEGGQHDLATIMCAALDTVGAGAPRYEIFGDIRREAEFWADCAQPIELELYAAAALQRIDRTQFAPRAKKRLLVSIWEALSDHERMAFLRRVDPGGSFIGGKVG